MGHKRKKDQSLANFSLLASLNSLDMLQEDLTEYDMDLFYEMGIESLSEGDIFILCNLFFFLFSFFFFVCLTIQKKKKIVAIIRFQDVVIG